MTLILGIDPGSRCTGYGIIASEKQQLRWITHGQINTIEDEFPQRLAKIYQTLKEVIALYQPQQAAIEQVFVKNNVQSALKLGQARGAAIVATAVYKLPLAEYSPRQIKQAIVGYGAASKNQVQHMVQSILRPPTMPSSDAADALAIALCHSHSQQTYHKLLQGKITAGNLL